MNIFAKYFSFFTVMADDWGKVLARHFYLVICCSSDNLRKCTFSQNISSENVCYYYYYY